MGCVQGKPSSSSSPPRGLERLKSDHGYVPGRASSAKLPPAGDQRPRASAVERVSEREKPPLPVPPLPPRQISAGEDELINGWPRWLVNNIPRKVLAGLVPKSADSYVKIDKVGQGTYSNVYKARDRDTGKVVALKKVRFDTTESESVKFMAREIMILQKLDHPNVLKLEGLATSRMHYSLYLVFDFMQSDLTRVISRRDTILTEPQIKCYMHQLLSGLQHCHERGILHRDIKGSNLLIDKNGVLKIGDFGLANYFDPNQKRPLTNRVVTLWYRAPELLLGSTNYGVGIDLWSAGCLLAEMFIGRPIMPGRTEVEQLHKIFRLCGSPSEDYWRRLKVSTNFQPPRPYKSTILETFKDFPSSSLSLLTLLLAIEPSDRGTALSALQSEFFITHPLACNLSDLPVLPKEEEDGATQLHRSIESVCRLKSSKPKQQLQEVADDQRMVDQAMDILKLDSGSSKEDEMFELGPSKKHNCSINGTSSGLNLNNNPTSLPKSFSQTESSNFLELSPVSELFSLNSVNFSNLTQEASKADAISSEQEISAAARLYNFEKRSNSLSGFSRYSGGEMPNSSKQHMGLLQRYSSEKRSNSTSELFRFSGEWRSTEYAIVE
ncbi:putative serine/threonine-protein kinase [Apostasia shenzhenica]|uniref:[RNA-polymerase]-subunit kinase n=1 Tax=Apostasia shenzhenica TaxID=1088818 RepID=A0A2I0B6Z3_9ASPA|nr:putative serine/threonine-protein kinase [Apostasia shenzhenica]